MAGIACGAVADQLSLSSPESATIRAPEGAVPHPASFRDPAGLVFSRDGVLHRQIQQSGAADWGAFLDRLYQPLLAEGLVVEHTDASLDAAAVPGAAAVVLPRRVEFISYPYEWAFSQLKEAALLTLDLQERALDAGMRLKDASAYNIQFDAGRPILIDTLSFEVAEPTDPWPAYRQFCEHFLGPLALIAYRDARCGLLLRDFIDGVPLDLAARLLPGRSRFNFGLLSHLHLHAGAQRRAQRAVAPPGKAKPMRRVSATGQRALLDSLRRTVAGLRWEPSGHWATYAGSTSYSAAATASKERAVRTMLADAGGRTAWDLGANTGVYSAMAADAGYRVIAWDQDASSVEAHWRRVRHDGNPAVLPLVLDLSNPSPAIGWALEERTSFLDRTRPDVVLALALVHHLAIGNNVPLDRIAALLARIATTAIVEFVPKEDPMTQHLLAARPDIFAGYSLDGFRADVREHFAVVDEVEIEDSQRRLFFLRAH